MADLNAAAADSISLTDSTPLGEIGMSGTAADTVGLTDTPGEAGMISVLEQAGWICLIEIAADSGTIRIASDYVRTPTGIYQGKVKRYGVFESSIPVPVDLVRINDVTCEIADTNGELRALFVPKTIKKRKISWLLGREGVPYVTYKRVFSAEVSDVRFPPGAVVIQCRSYVFDYYKEEVPSLLNKDYFSNLPDNPTGDFAPIILGTVSSAKGAIRCHRCDTNRYLVARHPCDAVSEVWVKGPEDEDFVKQMSGWSVTGRALYGSTSTEIQFSVTPDERAEVRANVVGMTIDPIYGGIDLTNFSDVIMAIVRFFVGVQYDLSHVNLSSFETVKAAVASLECAGAITQKCTFGQVMTDLVKSSGIDLYNDTYDRIAIAYSA